MFDAIKRLLIREAQRQPLCLVFEDLHWVDAETQTFLDALVESIPAARVLVLVNYRPEYETRWATKSYFSPSADRSTPGASADELLEALLGSTRSSTRSSRSLSKPQRAIRYSLRRAYAA